MTTGLQTKQHPKQSGREQLMTAKMPESLSLFTSVDD